VKVESEKQVKPIIQEESVMKKHMVGLGVVLNLICMLMLVPLAMAQPVENFHAVLAGDNQVSPVDTRARGLVTFQLSKDRTKLE
jgi:hypothetical protein